MPDLGGGPGAGRRARCATRHRRARPAPGVPRRRRRPAGRRAPHRPALTWWDQVPPGIGWGQRRADRAAPPRSGRPAAARTCSASAGVGHLTLTVDGDVVADGATTVPGRPGGGHDPARARSGPRSPLEAGRAGADPAGVPPGRRRRGPAGRPARHRARGRRGRPAGRGGAGGQPGRRGGRGGRVGADDRERGLRPQHAGAARTPGRAGPAGGRGQRPDGGRGERRACPCSCRGPSRSRR